MKRGQLDLIDLKFNYLCRSTDIKVSSHLGCALVAVFHVHQDPQCFQNLAQAFTYYVGIINWLQGMVLLSARYLWDFTHYSKFVGSNPICYFLRKHGALKVHINPGGKIIYKPRSNLN